MLSKRAGPGKCFVRAVLWMTALLSCTGCGTTLFAVHAHAAEQRLAEARELGAEELAPYEYYSAQAHLDKARSEASEAAYGDAIELAELSEAHAVRASELSRAARQGATP